MHIFIATLTITTIITGLSVMNGQTQNLAQSFPQMTSADISLKTLSPAKFTAPDYKLGVIQHIVLFRFKPETSAEQRKEVLDRFQQLKDTAKRNGEPYIISIVAGAQNTSFESAGQGFDQAFIVQFRSQGDRNYYVGTPAVTDPAFYDPAHQQFKTFVGPLLAENGALVYDFPS